MFILLPPFSEMVWVIRIHKIRYSTSKSCSWCIIPFPFIFSLEYSTEKGPINNTCHVSHSFFWLVCDCDWCVWLVSGNLLLIHSVSSHFQLSPQQLNSFHSVVSRSLLSLLLLVLLYFLAAIFFLISYTDYILMNVCSCIRYQGKWARISTLILPRKHSFNRHW